MTTLRPSPIFGAGIRCIFAATVTFALVAKAGAQVVPKKNLGGKIYVSEVNGDATIGTGTTFEEVNKRAVYNAQGAVLETTPGPGNDRDKSVMTIVYSNGTAATIGADTRLEIKRFTQDPFTSNRTDLDVEPSTSQTHAFIARGQVGIFTSKAATGSVMIYQTPHGSLNIRGRKVVIETGPAETKIAVLDGESTFRGATPEIGAHTLRAGQLALIQRTAPGEPGQIQIARLSPAEVAQLTSKVTGAETARRTVYFRERTGTTETEKAALAATTTAAAGAADAAAGAESVEGAVETVFDTTAAAGSQSGGGGVRDIVPVETTPVTLPTEFTISTSRLSK